MMRFATRLVDHAASVMPAARQDWAQAMRAEVAYIPDPVAAVLFALGCVRASYVQGIAQPATLTLLARWTLAAYALVAAGCYLLATVLVLSIQALPGLRPQDLGAGPGTVESLRFVQEYPVSGIANFPLVAIALSVGAILLARRRPEALPLIATGVASAVVIALLDTGADWPLAWSSAWITPIVCLGPVWWLSRRAPDLPAA